MFCVHETGSTHRLYWQLFHLAHFCVSTVSIRRQDS